MVASAEKAGFNPLTALRNGGAAGFTTTTSPAPLSVGEAIGDAVSAAGNFLQNFDPYADKRREVEFNLVEAQIANLNANTAAVSGMAKPGTMNVPAYTAGPVERRPSGQAAQLSPAGWLDPPKATGEALPIWVPGVDRDGKRIWIPNPDGPDAEQLMFGALTRSQAGWEAAAGAALSGDYGSVRKLREEEKRQADAEAGWLPSWVPRVKVKWK